MIPLALWLQEEKPSGTAGRVEVHRKLTDVYLEEEGLTRDGAGLPRVREAESKAERFLREMRQMTGLIVERGHDAFGFLHLTFQEFFAGRALAQKDDASRWEVIRRHLHDPRWQEPIMLCAGRLGVAENRRAQVTSLARSILEHEDATEGDLRRNLQLALAIACDDVYLEPQLIDRLVETAVGCVPSGVHAIDRALMTVREALLEKLKDDNYAVRQSAVSALSSSLGRDETVREALLEKLDEGDAFPVRLRMIDALLPFLTEEPAYWIRVRPWLSVDTDVDYLHSSDVELLRRFQEEFAQVIGERSARDPSLRDELLDQLTDVRASARVGAALALLASPDAPTSDVVSKVLAAVDDRRGLESYPARLTAASFLLNRNETSAEAVELCLEALDYGTQPWEYLRNSRDVRKQAALVLGKLEPLESNQRAYDKLLHVMKHDEDADVRDAAYGALVRLARARELGETGR